MWVSLTIVVGAVIAAGGLVRLKAFWRRRQGSHRIAPEDRVRAELGLSMRLLRGAGMDVQELKKTRATRTRGDLVLGKSRFILSTGQGILADLGPGRGRKFTAVRCPGPGRLIIEGDTPTAKGMEHYRIDIRVADAAWWATALKPFICDGGEFVVFGRAKAS